MNGFLPFATAVALVLVTPFRPCTAEMSVLTTTAELLQARNNPDSATYTFDLTGGVRRLWKENDFILTDETGSVCLNSENATPPPDESRIRVTGSFKTPRGRWCLYEFSTLTILGTAPPVRPTDVPFADLVSTTPDYSYVRTEATVRDVQPDDISPDYVRFLLTDGPCALQAALRTDEPLATRPATELIGARIRLTGTLFMQRLGGRQFDSKLLLADATNGIEILQAKLDPFDYPGLGSFENLRPEELTQLGRRTISGVVRAVWQNDRFLLEADGASQTVIKRLIHVHLANGETPPVVGDRIQTVGDVTTDRFQLILTKALNRFVSREPPTFETPVETDISSVFPQRGKPFVDRYQNGRTLSFRGLVRDLPKPRRKNGQALIESGNRTLVMDASSCPEVLDGLDVGTEIRATGVFVFEADPWHADTPFTRINRCLFVLRHPADLVVLNRPSPFTPRVLGWTTGALVLCLIGVLIWNRLLNHLVERRSRELTREQVSRLAETLRVDERTRLAVELHDSLSQNLSGVAFQIGAALELFKSDVRAAGETLLSVQRMLLSCRGELKRCLWDLREDTLSERDFSEAIRRTLRPVIGETVLRLRFNIDRSRLHDATAHALLCIIRELAANAVHHGHAKNLRIAGECHGGTLSFSVRDDGCGFDVERQKRSAGTHFGLSGIAERVKRLSGTFTIVSTSGDTRASVILPIQQNPIFTK